jgi:hypothetical protein
MAESTAERPSTAFVGESPAAGTGVALRMELWIGREGLRGKMAG